MKIFLACLLSLIAFSNVVQADPYSDEIETALKEIISQPDFQPRREPPSFFDKYRKQLGAYVANLIDRFNRWIRSFSGFETGTSSVGDYIVRLLIALKYIFYGVVVFLVVAPLFYLLYKKLKPLLASNHVVVSKEQLQAPAEATSLGLEELLAHGRFYDLLHALRAQLRLQLQQAFRISPSATDRETRTALSKNEPLTELFSELSRLFERTVFARETLDENKLCSLYNQYQTMHRTPQ